MKNLVVLKSFSSGISVIMDATVPFDELLEAVAEKFRSAANFFKDAAAAISIFDETEFFKWLYAQAVLLAFEPLSLSVKEFIVGDIKNNILDITHTIKFML